MLSRFGRLWKIDPIGNSGDAVACGRGGRMCDAPDPIIEAAVSHYCDTVARAAWCDAAYTRTASWTGF